MKYIIIGLGNYGHVLAEELSALGHEIIGADISESRVDSIKDKVATAFVIDATDEQSLSVLPLNSVDIVIVAIGENFGAACLSFVGRCRSFHYFAFSSGGICQYQYHYSFSIEHDLGLLCSEYDWSCRTFLGKRWYLYYS